MPEYFLKNMLSDIIRGMNMLMERYADIILRRALRLREGDVLSINAESENSDFAHLIARKAREITGNGSYIQNIENGKVTATEEAASDYAIEKKPTALLYLPVYRSYMKAERGKLFTAPEIQRFRHLSDPLDNSDPMIPFASAPVPSSDWGKVLDEDGDISLPSTLLSDLLGLGEDDYLAGGEDTDLILYERDRLNGFNLKKGRIRDEDGTDLEFSFLEGSQFMSSIMVLPDGRKFIPTIYASDIFRALEKTSAEGYFTATKPFMLFGHIVRSFSARVEHGKITDFSTDSVSMPLFRHSDAILAPSTRKSPVSFLPFFSFRERRMYFVRLSRTEITRRPLCRHLHLDVRKTKILLVQRDSTECFT